MPVTVVIGGRVIKVVASGGGHAGSVTVVMGDGGKVLGLNLQAGVVSVCGWRPIVAIAEYSIFLILPADRSGNGRMQGGKCAIPHAERPASIDWRKFSKWSHGALMVVVNVGSGAWRKT